LYTVHPVGDAPGGGALRLAAQGDAALFSFAKA
jgi:hypothetical protein